jgi:hypothetical protein
MGTRFSAARGARLGIAAFLAAAALLVGLPSLAHAAGIVLTVQGPTGKTRSYTLKQLRTGFPAYKGYAGYVKTGFVGMERPHPVRGVRLLDLLAKVGYKRGPVTLTAVDGVKYKYSSDLVRGLKVTMYKASAPKYPLVTVPKTNPLTAILAYQDKKAGARVDDSSPWRNYTRTFQTDGGDGIGPLRFWWSYKKRVQPGYLQIGWSSMRMVDTVSAR